MIKLDRVYIEIYRRYPYVSSKKLSRWMPFFFTTNLILRLKTLVIVQMKFLSLFCLFLNKQTNPENWMVSTWKLLIPILENQKLSGGIFQNPQDIAFQNIFLKSFRDLFRVLSKNGFKSGIWTKRYLGSFSAHVPSSYGGLLVGSWSWSDSGSGWDKGKILNPDREYCFQIHQFRYSVQSQR